MPEEFYNSRFAFAIVLIQTYTGRISGITAEVCAMAKADKARRHPSSRNLRMFRRTHGCVLFGSREARTK
jgi:hypothetical protein